MLIGALIAWYHGEIDTRGMIEAALMVVAVVGIPAILVRL